jgi:hypothetical protein
MRPKYAALFAALLMSILFAGCQKPSPDSGGDEAGKVYEFAYKGASITINAKAEPVLSALGAYSSYYESPSCAFEGMDKIYSYPGFDVATYTLGGVEYVNSVVLTDDSVATPEGLAIGSKIEEVGNAYPGISQSGTSFTAGQNGASKLLIITKDGIVSSIQYISLAGEAD